MEKSREKVSCSESFAEGIGQRDALLVDAVVAHRGAQAQFQTLRRRGDDVDHAGGGIRAVHAGAGTAQHLDLRHGIQRHGDIHIVMAGLDVVQAQAVEQHQGLAEAAAANGKIGLHAVGSALLQVERRVQPQQVGQGVGDQVHAARRQQRDGAVHLIQRERLEGAGHHDGFVLRQRVSAVAGS